MFLLGFFFASSRRIFWWWWRCSSFWIGWPWPAFHQGNNVIRLIPTTWVSVRAPNPRPKYNCWIGMERTFPGDDFVMEKWPCFWTIFGKCLKNWSSYHRCKYHQVYQNTPLGYSTACCCFHFNSIFSAFCAFPHLHSSVKEAECKHDIFCNISGGWFHTREKLWMHCVVRCV